jgi:hypothetical protein
MGNLIGCFILIFLATTLEQASGIYYSHTRSCDREGQIASLAQPTSNNSAVLDRSITEGSRQQENYAEAKDVLFPVYDDEQYGYIDRSGQLVIKIKRGRYHEEFHEGLAVVINEDGKLGYINETGEYVIEPIYADSSAYDYDDIGARHFSEGLAVVSEEVEVEDGTYFQHLGYIDKTGKIVIKLADYELYPFSEGMALIRQLPVDPSSDSEQLLPLSGFIDRQGNMVVEPKFGDAKYFSEGLAAVRPGIEVTDEWGYIDESGNFAIEPKFDEAGSFSEGLAPVGVLQDGFYPVCYGFINKQGELAIAPKFTDAKEFSEGFAAVAIEEGKDKKWGYIDKSGEFVIEPQFENTFFDDAAGPFRNGLAMITIKKPVPIPEDLIDDIGDKTDTLYTDVVGFIDKSGKWVVEPNLSPTKGFKHGLAYVSVYEPYAPHRSTSISEGYIDSTGQFIWHPQSKP